MGARRTPVLNSISETSTWSMGSDMASCRRVPSTLTGKTRWRSHSSSGTTSRSARSISVLREVHAAARRAAAPGRSRRTSRSGSSGGRGCWPGARRRCAGAPGPRLSCASLMRSASQQDLAELLPRHRHPVPHCPLSIGIRGCGAAPWGARDAADRREASCASRAVHVAREAGTCARTRPSCAPCGGSWPCGRPARRRPLTTSRCALDLHEEVALVDARQGRPAPRSRSAVS